MDYDIVYLIHTYEMKHIPLRIPYCSYDYIEIIDVGNEMPTLIGK